MKIKTYDVSLNWKEVKENEIELKRNENVANKWLNRINKLIQSRWIENWTNERIKESIEKKKLHSCTELRKSEWICL